MLDSLDAGPLQCILDFLLYHDPHLGDYFPWMDVGRRDLVFRYEGRRYKATTWRPRSHYGRCPYKSCGCCRALDVRDANKGCQECYAGWTLTTLSKFFRKVTNLQAWRTCSCRCGGCAASWIKAGWDCPVRCGNEWSDIIEKNSWWEIPVSRAVATEKRLFIVGSHRQRTQ